jgi:predicted nucleotide-binding protein
MQDIWKSICEARLVIADLSDFNANVMYELGISHTVGKDTILLCEKSEDDVKFPFDLTHIRRIEYKNEISSTKKLEMDLIETIRSVLSGKPLNEC